MSKAYIYQVIIIGAFFCGVAVVYAATNIDATHKWGWNDIIGWLDMNVTDTVMVTPSVIQGYASSSVGNIMFDCATTPIGDTCNAVDFKTAHDGAGNLSEWAWSEVIGWISMSGVTADNQSYQVKILPGGEESDFDGWAWSDVGGWLNFNCLMSSPPTDSCASNSYKTQTSGGPPAPVFTAIFISSIFDIGTTTGIFNTIAWQGSQPAGTTVQFQIATAISSAELTGDMAVVFPSSRPWLSAAASPPGNPVKITTAIAGVPVENRRYIRYRAMLKGSKTSPRIDDIVIGWSP